MSYEAHKEEHEGLTIRIVADEDASNPREEFDHVARMWCWHGRYNLGDYKDRPKDVVRYPELEAEVGEKILIAKPLFLYDHSGITISTSAFSCQWDSGQVGWVFVTLKKAQEESGRKTRRAQRRWAERVIDGEVAEYDHYLTGNVYGFIVETKPEDAGEEPKHLESCWGFYGDYDAKNGVLDEARSIAKHCAAGLAAKKAQAVAYVEVAS